MYPLALVLVAAAPALDGLRASGGAVCTRSAGELTCWGQLGSAFATTPHRLGGFGEVDGWAALGTSLLVWDHEGRPTVAGDWKSAADGEWRPGWVTRSLTVAPPVSMHGQSPRTASSTSHGALALKDESPSVAAAEDPCMLTRDGRVLCGSLAWTGGEVVELPFHLSALGSGGFCGVDEQGTAVVFNTFDFPLSPGAFPDSGLGAFAQRKLPVLGKTRSVACVSSLEAVAGSVVCALGPKRAIRCTHPEVQTRLVKLVGRDEARQLFAVPRTGFCAELAGGEVRCVPGMKGSPEGEAVLAAVARLDASRGFGATNGRVFCGLGEDAVVRCLGNSTSPALGTGASSRLEQPVELRGAAAADELSAGCDSTCARFGDQHVRCFGLAHDGPMSAHELKLPGPVDRIAGGGEMACVHVTKDDAWYCRDPSARWFPGPLPDHFARLVDADGGAVRDVARIEVPCGRGILVWTRDGRAGAFFLSGRSEPLRVLWSDDANLARAREAPVAAPDAGVPPLVQTFSSGCGVDGNRRVWCWGSAYSVERPAFTLEPRQVLGRSQTP